MYGAQCARAVACALRRGVRRRHEETTRAGGLGRKVLPAEEEFGSRPRSFRGQAGLTTATESRVIDISDEDARDGLVANLTHSAQTRFDLDQETWFGRMKDEVVQPPLPVSIKSNTESPSDLRRTLEGEQLVPQTWGELGLTAEFQKIAEEFVGSRPATIQKDIVPAILNVTDRDIIYSSVTGSGKTVAYLLALLQKVAQEERGVSLIVVPSKQLALQIYAHCLRWTKKGSIYGRNDKEWLQLHLNDDNEDERKLWEGYNNLKSTWYGGVRLVIAQPGRWADYLLNWRLSLPIRRVVLDEAFTLFDPIHPVTSRQQDRIARTLNPLPADIVMSYYLSFPAFRTIMRAQIIMLTATFSELLQNHVVRYLKPDRWAHLTTRQLPNALDHRFVICPPSTVIQQFLTEAERLSPPRAVVFTSNTSDIDVVYETMTEAGLNTRLFDLKDGTPPPFQDYGWRYLLMKEEAAFGLDLKGVTHVFVLHTPSCKEAYCHMAGRAGRFGTRGLVVGFVEDVDQNLNQWASEMQLLDIDLPKHAVDCQTGLSAEGRVTGSLVKLREELLKPELLSRRRALQTKVDGKQKVLYNLARPEGALWEKTAPPGSFPAVLEQAERERATQPLGPMTDLEVSVWRTQQKRSFVEKAQGLNLLDQRDGLMMHQKEFRYDLAERMSFYRIMNWHPKAKVAKLRYKAFKRRLETRRHVLDKFMHDRLLRKFTPFSLAPDGSDPNPTIPPVSRKLGGAAPSKWAKFRDLPPYPGSAIDRENARFDHALFQRAEDEHNNPPQLLDSGKDASSPEPDEVTEHT